MTLDLNLFLFAVPAVILIGLSKGGFAGLGALGTPLLAIGIGDPIQAAAVLLPILIAQDVVGVAAFRKQWDRRVLAVMLPGAVVGILLGYLLAARISAAAVMAALGLISMLFGFYRLWIEARAEPLAVAGSAWSGSLFGVAAGFTSQIAHAGGPPFQIYAVPQRMPKMVFAGTSTLLFAAINAMKIPPYWALGQLNPTNLMITAWLAPVAVAATFIGVWVNRRLPEVLFYRLVIGALFVLSLKLVYDGIMEFGGGVF